MIERGFDKLFKSKIWYKTPRECFEKAKNNSKEVNSSGFR